MAKSLLHMISNDIGQLACLYAKLHCLDRVYFGGFFIRGHPVTMRTITYSINFFSKVTGLRFLPPPAPRAVLFPDDRPTQGRGGPRAGRRDAGCPLPASPGPLPLSCGGFQRPRPRTVAVSELGTMAAVSTLGAVSPCGRAELRDGCRSAGHSGLGLQMR